MYSLSTPVNRKETNNDIDQINESNFNENKKDSKPNLLYQSVDQNDTLNIYV